MSIPRLMFDGLKSGIEHRGQVLVSVALYNKARSYIQVGNVQHMFTYV